MKGDNYGKTVMHVKSPYSDSTDPIHGKCFSWAPVKSDNWVDFVKYMAEQEKVICEEAHYEQPCFCEGEDAGG